jgi:hypothetical protein
MAVVAIGFAKEDIHMREREYAALKAGLVERFGSMKATE